MPYNVVFHVHTDVGIYSGVWKEINKRVKPSVDDLIIAGLTAHPTRDVIVLAEANTDSGYRDLIERIETPNSKKEILELINESTSKKNPKKNLRVNDLRPNNHFVEFSYRASDDTDKKFYLVKGVEFHTNELPHLLAFLYDDFLGNISGLVKTLKDTKEALNYFKSKDSILIIPHPFALEVGGISEEELEEIIAAGIRPDAIEWNAQFHPLVDMFFGFKRKAVRFSEKYKIPLVVGVDLQRIDQLNSGYVVFNELNFSSGKTLRESIKKALEEENYENVLKTISLRSFISYYFPEKAFLLFNSYIQNIFK